MLMTLTGLLATALAGSGCLAIVGRLRNSMRVNWAVRCGIGFALGIILVSAAIRFGGSLGLSLGDSARLVTAVSLGIAIFGLYLDRHDLQLPRVSRQGVSLHLLLIGLLTLHFALAITNNLTRPVFAWDAFTTWMFTAKAWATTNQWSAMTNSIEWIALNGPSSFAIHAHHYPVAVSTYAAYLSALDGPGWNEQAASLAWPAIMIALATTVAGVLRMAGIGSALAMVGAYLLVSMPLIDMHAAIAGYADIWMALYAGVGLACICIWYSRRIEAALMAGVLLLLAGTQVKLEGWLWLGVGALFLLLSELARRFGWKLLLAALALLLLSCYFSSMTTLNFGALGKWGFDDTHIHATSEACNPPTNQ